MRSVRRRPLVPVCEYVALARGTVTCMATTVRDAWSDHRSEVLVDVRAVLLDGTPVITGVVTLKISRKP